MSGYPLERREEAVTVDDGVRMLVGVNDVEDEGPQNT